MDVVAGFNPNNSNWNFNGYYDGDMTVVVPQGWRVEITLTNRDGDVPHSLVVMADPGADNLPLQAGREQAAFPARLLQEPGTGHLGRRPRHHLVQGQRDRRLSVVLRRPRPRAKRHVDALRGHRRRRDSLHHHRRGCRARPRLTSPKRSKTVVCHFLSRSRISSRCFRASLVTISTQSTSKRRSTRMGTRGDVALSGLRCRDPQGNQ